MRERPYIRRSLGAGAAGGGFAPAPPGFNALVPLESLKKRGVEDFFPLPRASQLEFRRRAEWGLRIPLSYLDTCASPKLHPAEKLNRRLDILTVKSRLDRPTRASWKAMKTQADGILARHKSVFVTPKL